MGSQMNVKCQVLFRCSQTRIATFFRQLIRFNFPCSAAIVSLTFDDNKVKLENK